ncbi:alanine racemase [Rhodohalobacter sp. SW132]|uniref:alanine racemase n=1 Tax=Rhodohalobacter sp. SW132 TaxID=2293433 RepID=UPI000E22F43E|nr:alanine racemase [Rhodohalobacter sp. SW132]REL33730.1 alanine racemase [Rhodohalobacter sp. SW132]
MKLHFPNSYAEIDLNSITKNLKQLRKRTGIKKILSVVKCNAYGHGAIEVAKRAEPDVDWFGVATVDEAIELRLGGIKKPILVFEVPSPRSAAAYQTHGLTATLSDFPHFSTLMDGTKYHIHFDTGMNRLGFKPSQAGKVRKMAVANQRLICSGIYSHYQTADDPGSDFVNTQQEIFREILKDFKEIPLVHMSNTGAAVHYNENNQFDMIRTGLAQLGYTAGRTQVDWLTPSLTWKSRIVQTLAIEAGESVSYGQKWTAQKSGYIGTIPVGYGDGILRSLSNKLQVKIRGEFYPVVGNITMDYTMVDLGDVKIAVDEEVVLMGGEAWSAAEWAEAAGTNVHEILTALNGRMARSYTDYS